MKRSFTVFTALLCSVSFIPLAGATQTDTHASPLTDWHVAPVLASGPNQSPYCAMATNYPAAGVIITHARNKKGSGTVAFDFANADFEAHQYYGITIGFGGAPQQFAAEARNTHLLVIELRNDHPLYAALDAGHDIDVAVEQGGPHINVAGNSRAFFQLNYCVQALSDAPSGTATAAAPQSADPAFGLQQPAFVNTSPVQNMTPAPALQTASEATTPSVPMQTAPVQTAPMQAAPMQAASVKRVPTYNNLLWDGAPAPIAGDTLRAVSGNQTPVTPHMTPRAAPIVTHAAALAVIQPGAGQSNMGQPLNTQPAQALHKIAASVQQAEKIVAQNATAQDGDESRADLDTMLNKARAATTTQTAPRQKLSELSNNDADPATPATLVKPVDVYDGANDDRTIEVENGSAPAAMPAPLPMPMPQTPQQAAAFDTPTQNAPVKTVAATAKTPVKTSAAPPVTTVAKSTYKPSVAAPVAVADKPAPVANKPAAPTPKMAQQTPAPIVGSGTAHDALLFDHPGDAGALTSHAPQLSAQDHTVEDRTNDKISSAITPGDVAPVSRPVAPPLALPATAALVPPPQLAASSAKAPTTGMVEDKSYTVLASDYKDGKNQAPSVTAAATPPPAIQWDAAPAPIADAGTVQAALATTPDAKPAVPSIAKPVAKPMVTVTPKHDVPATTIVAQRAAKPLSLPPQAPIENIALESVAPSVTPAPKKPLQANDVIAKASQPVPAKAAAMPPAIMADDDTTLVDARTATHGPMKRADQVVQMEFPDELPGDDDIHTDVAVKSVTPTDNASLATPVGLLQNARFDPAKPVRFMPPAAPAAGIWQTKAVPAQNDMPAYCILQTRFANQQNLFLSRGINGNTIIGLDFGMDLLQRNQDYKTTVQVDNAFAEDFLAQARAANLLVIEAGRKDSLYQALAQGKAMHIEMPGTAATFDISGIASQLPSFSQCLTAQGGTPINTATMPVVATAAVDATDMQAPSADKMMAAPAKPALPSNVATLPPVPQAAPAPSAPAPALPHLSLAQIDTMLRQAGLMPSNLQLAADGYQWNDKSPAGDLQGAFSEKHFKAGKADLQEAAMRDIDAQEATCHSPSFTSQVNLPTQDGDTEALTAETSCTQNDKTTVAALLYQRIGQIFRVWTQTGPQGAHDMLIQQRDRLANVLQRDKKTDIVTR